MPTRLAQRMLEAAVVELGLEEEELRLRRQRSRARARYGATGTTAGDRTLPTGVRASVCPKPTHNVAASG